jgi:photoactive yellow protein
MLRGMMPADPPPPSHPSRPPVPGTHLSHEAHKEEILSTVDMMSSEELDTLPYGMIQLDATGRILKYNMVESRLAQLPQETTVGKKFFSEIAPCTKVQQFYGQFKEGVLRESLDTTFQFHFAFKQNPRDVTVRLFYSKRTRSVWVMISDREGNPIA